MESKTETRWSREGGKNTNFHGIANIRRRANRISIIPCGKQLAEDQILFDYKVIKFLLNSVVGGQLAPTI